MSATRSSTARPPASLLWWLYVAEGMGCPAIGALFERDPKTVLWWLRQAGIPTRPRGSDRRQWLKPGHRMNLEMVWRRLIKGRSAGQVARMERRMGLR